MNATSHIKDIVQLNQNLIGEPITRDQVRKRQNLLIVSPNQITIGTVLQKDKHQITVATSILQTTRLHGTLTGPDGAEIYLLPKNKKLFSKKGLPEVSDFVVNQFKYASPEDLTYGMHVLYFFDNHQTLVLGKIEHFNDTNAFLEDGPKASVSKLMVPHTPEALDEMPNLQRLLGKIEERNNEA